MEPPPAKVSATKGTSSPYAALIRALEASTNEGLKELFQSEKSPMNFKSASCSPASVGSASPCKRGRILLALSLKVPGQEESQGSGSKRASSIARHAAKGRRAHQSCRVLGCPCRIDFSCAECLLTTAIGKSTSARRLHSLGIISVTRRPYAFSVSVPSSPNRQQSCATSTLLRSRKRVRW